MDISLFASDSESEIDEGLKFRSAKKRRLDPEESPDGPFNEQTYPSGALLEKMEKIFDILKKQQVMIEDIKDSLDKLRQEERSK